MEESSIPENYDSEKSENKLPLGLSVAAIVISVLAIVFAYSSKNTLGSQVEAQSTEFAEFSEKVNQNFADFTSKSGAERIDRLEARLAALENKLNLGFEEISNAMKNMEKDVLAVRSTGRSNTSNAQQQRAPVVAGDGEYVIAKGDNPTVIARKLGCNVADLMAVNPGLDPKKLKIGQKIKVPTK